MGVGLVSRPYPANGVGGGFVSLPYPAHGVGVGLVSLPYPAYGVGVGLVYLPYPAYGVGVGVSGSCSLDPAAGSIWQLVKPLYGTDHALGHVNLRETLLAWRSSGKWDKRSSRLLIRL